MIRNSKESTAIGWDVAKTYVFVATTLEFRTLKHDPKKLFKISKAWMCFKMVKETNCFLFVSSHYTGGFIRGSTLQRLYIYIYMWLYIYMVIYIYIYMVIHIYIYVYMVIYIYGYIYIHGYIYIVYMYITSRHTVHSSYTLKYPANPLARPPTMADARATHQLVVNELVKPWESRRAAGSIL